MDCGVANISINQGSAWSKNKKPGIAKGETGLVGVFS
jgi:hypothetical protein